jgi:protein-L-isoaspartate(D-aspartate) O-methyltransferase
MTDMTRTLSHPSSAAARRAMVDSQLRTSGVNEEYVLARMLAVPREDFLPAEKASFAYIDRAVSLGSAPGSGGYLAAPLFYGKLLLEAAPTPDDRVLVVSGGTDYLAALLGPLVTSVTAITASDAVTTSATESYSLIMIDGAIEHLPDGLAAQVAEGGRIVTGLVLRQVTRLASGRKIGGMVTLQPIEDLGMPMLPAFAAPKRWTFA